MYNSNEVATRIRIVAKEKNVGVGGMLEKCNLNKDTVSLMVRRGSWIQSDSLAKIADVLDCSVDYLLGRTETPEIGGRELSAPEAALINTYRELNEDGRRYLAETADVASQMPKYKKLPRHEVAG